MIISHQEIEDSDEEFQVYLDKLSDTYLDTNDFEYQQGIVSS